MLSGVNSALVRVNKKYLRLRFKSEYCFLDPETFVAEFACKWKVKYTPSGVRL